MHWNAGSEEVVIGEAADVEHLRGGLCVFAKEAILVATLDKENAVAMFGFDCHELLLERCVLGSVKAIRVFLCLAFLQGGVGLGLRLGLDMGIGSGLILMLKSWPCLLAWG